MNTKLFKPLNEQIQVVNIKNKPITEAEFREAANQIIFNESIQSLLNDITNATEMPLNEASLFKGRKLRKKLYKLRKEYEIEADPIKKEELFQKIEEHQKKMERLGFDPVAKEAEGIYTDKKLLKAAEDYEGTTDPKLKDKAMKKYEKRSDKLGKKGKPNEISSMEQEKIK